MTTAPPRRPVSHGPLGFVLLGDWSRAVRDPVDLVRLSYLGGAIAALAGGEAGHGVRFLLTFLVVLAPRALDAPRLFDFFFTTTLGLQAWGNFLGAFGNGNLFDRFDHLLSPMGLAPLFYLWFVRMELLPRPREEVRRFRAVGIVVIGFSIGLSIGALYEIYEYVANSVGGGLHINETDTVLDMSMDALGALVGSIVLLAWVTVGPGTERRLPAELRTA